MAASRNLKDTGPSSLHREGLNSANKHVSFPRRKWQPPPACFSGKSHGGKGLAGYCPRGCQRVRHNLATRNSNSRICSFLQQDSQTSYL